MTSPPRGITPHVRLNSGTENILLRQTSNEQRPGYSRTNTERSLTPLNTGLYLQNNLSAADSKELLLPPTKGRSRTRKNKDAESPMSPRSPSGWDSRRTSWSSDGSRDSRYGPFASPFDDSRAPSRAGSSDDEGGVNTQTVSEKYNILPGAGLLLFPEDVEKDDYLHNPDPNEKDRNDCDIFSRRGLVNVGGLLFIVLGIFALFVGYPI